MKFQNPSRGGRRHILARTGHSVALKEVLRGSPSSEPLQTDAHGGILHPEAPSLPQSAPGKQDRQTGEMARGGNSTHPLVGTGQEGRGSGLVLRYQISTETEVETLPEDLSLPSPWGPMRMGKGLGSSEPVAPQPFVTLGLNAGEAMGGAAQRKLRQVPEVKSRAAKFSPPPARPLCSFGDPYRKPGTGGCCQACRDSNKRYNFYRDSDLDPSGFPFLKFDL